MGRFTRYSDSLIAGSQLFAYGLGTRRQENHFRRRFRTMPTETFKASRWTRGNFLFPTYIEVNEQAVTRHKRSWFSRDEISVSMSKVASVHIKSGMIWS